MAAKYFLKHGIPFQYNPNIGIPERVNLMTIKCADQLFELGYKPKKEDYRRVSSMKREKRMAKIEGIKP